MTKKPQKTETQRRRRKSDLYTDAPSPSKHLRVVIVGHIDHGKSTLIGRLLYDTKSLPDGKYEELQEICERRGTAALEWSFVLDSFQAERDQAITIDTTQIWFSSKQRDYVIIDAPGHREFLKNMISGAASADAAILVVDAIEGVKEQTKRHAYLLSLLGLTQIAVVVNKMDSVDFDAKRFKAVSKEIKEYLGSINLQPSAIIPISAREGDMIASSSDRMLWHGDKHLINVLDSFSVSQPPVTLDFRFPVQDVCRFDEERILVGRVESGVVREGDKVLFSPTNEEAEITSIKVWPDDKGKIKAFAGEVIGITLDQPIFVERGHIGSHVETPPMLSNVFRANIFWLAAKPLKIGNSYKIRYGTNETMVSVQSINRVVDTDNLSQDDHAGGVEKNAVAEITLRARDMIPLDPYLDNPQLGRIVLYENHDIVGGGTLNMDGYADQRRAQPKSENIYKVDHLMSQASRAKRNGHHGGVFWFTGLSGSGKSTLAMSVENALFEKGYHTYVLDGDNVRHGLNTDLGFSPEDRSENIRRVGEVAALMADAGLIVISAFISPYRTDRDNARKACPDSFHEIHVNASLETCEARDPKGLYKKARAGKIPDFTGIDSPYEEPENPEIIADTQNNTIETCVEQIIAYVEGHIALKKEAANDQNLGNTESQDIAK
jgi:bifunctional enzyme CysN/CysC